jgi:Flp pilus assembly protein TadD
MLEALCADPKQQAAAARALIKEGVARRENAQRLVQLARELQAYPEATFNDRLLLLDFLHQLQDEQFGAYLTELEKNAVANPSELAALLSWMGQNHLNLLALDFIKTLPRDATQKWPLPRVLADVYLQLRDWPALDSVTRNANWGQFEFLRHAYLSRALRERSDKLGAESAWTSAVHEASADSRRLHALEQHVATWGWEKETTDLLWMLGKDAEMGRSALAALYQHYLTREDTVDLYRVATRLCDMSPDDENAQNNFAQLSLLLNVNTERACAVAEHLYKKDPKNAVFSSTYAFALYRQGRYQQAAKVLNDLKPDDLRQPQIAAYYGMFLAAAGDKTRAAEYLERGSTAQLLPEERALVEEARGKIKTSPH